MANVGDTAYGGPPISEGITKISATTKGCDKGRERCCWQGKTAKTCTNSWIGTQKAKQRL